MTLKKITMALVAATTMAMAGGNIAPVEVEVEQALTGFYVGGAYSATANDITLGGVNGFDLGTDATHNGFTGIAGYNINEYVAVEGRYTWMATETYALASDLDGNTWGVYVKPQYGFGDAKIYGLLGYGQTTVSGSALDVLDNEGSFQYGVGAAYSVTRNVEVFGDWIRAYDDSTAVNELANASVESDVFTFGVNYKF